MSADFFVQARKGPRSGAGEKVYSLLRHAIVTLELRPGQPLDKSSLAEQFGVSRAPVYGAFTRLQAEALVDIVPQRGTSVSLIRMSDARENMFLRRAIEVETVRTIVPRISEAQVNALGQNLHYQAAALASRDVGGFHRFDVEFHALLFEVLGFDRVKACADMSRLGLDRVRRLLSSRRRQELTIEEHQDVFEAVRRRKADDAAAAMGRHLDAVMRELEGLAAERPELFADLQARPETA